MTTAQQDLSREAADRWIEHESAADHDYESLVRRIADERTMLSVGGEKARAMFPVAAWAREALLERLERRREKLKAGFH